MGRIVYLTATSLDGFLADPDGSLDWLFAVPGGEEAIAEVTGFADGVGVMVEGSTTYNWVLDHEQLIDHPDKWQQFYADKPTFVFTTREQPVVAGADVRFVSGPVADHLNAIREAAGGLDVWVVGGGALAAQFAEIGALDEIRVQIASTLLGAGAPLFGGRIESDRLRLVDLSQAGQFVVARYQLS